MNVAERESAALSVQAVRPTPASGPDLAVGALAARYGDRPPVFADVDFSVAPGESVALVGANGSGKSTLLRCCLGFVAPCAGEVRLFGSPLGGLGTAAQRRLRSNVGFVAQKHNLVPRFSALTNVVHGLLARTSGPRHWLQAIAPSRSRERALEALDRVGLAHLALQRADALSGGQSQRVAIARALVAEPRMILADEPAASLDPAAGEEVMDVFTRVVAQTGTTLVFTTHNLDHALGYSGRVLGLKAGRLVLDTPATQLAAGALRELYD